MQDTKTIWQERVAGWRASGETAAEFSAKQNFEPTTLRYWASRLKREPADAAPAAGPLVKLARVVRSPSRGVPDRVGSGVVVEVLDARVRVILEEGATREMLDLVFGALGVGGGR